MINKIKNYILIKLIINMYNKLKYHPEDLLISPLRFMKQNVSSIFVINNKYHSKISYNFRILYISFDK